MSTAGLLGITKNNSIGLLSEFGQEYDHAEETFMPIPGYEVINETKAAEETLRSIMEGTAAVIGGDFFASMVRHLARALQVRYAFVTECREREKTTARTLAFWMGDRLADNISYEIAETPCLKVLAGETCYYPQG